MHHKLKWVSNDWFYLVVMQFWTELTPQARKKLLRVDKQTLFEHARKNMYCSRCNGLLLEGFLQIVMYVKSLQQDAAECHYGGGDTNNQNYGDFCTTNGCHGDVLDPSVHPWGGLSTSRDGALTLLDCYLYSKSLEGLQKVNHFMMIFGIYIFAFLQQAPKVKLL